MKHLLYRVLDHFCTDCDGLMWPWQASCGQRHTACAHAGILTSWRRNLDATGGPLRPWPCAYCKTIPTEARP